MCGCGSAAASAAAAAAAAKDESRRNFFYAGDQNSNFFFSHIFPVKLSCFANFFDFMDLCVIKYCARH